MPGRKAAVSWSGGKDSYLALNRTAEEFDIRALVTMFTEDGAWSRSHGLRPSVIARQADLLGVPLLTGRCSWESYEDEFKRILKQLAKDGVSHIIFGDIFPDQHRVWAERVCNAFSLKAVEPLWGEQTSGLLQEFMATDAQAQIVSARADLLDDRWLGRRLSPEMLPEFEGLGVDPCGERGEYHTLVFAAPRMTMPLGLREAGRMLHHGYRLLDLELA